MLTRAAVATVLAFAAATHAQAPGVATAAQLAIVDAQYANSGFAQSGNAGFGTELRSAALLTVEYDDDDAGVIQNGNAYTVAQVSDGPDIYITPSAATAGQFNSSTRYTVILADASSLGDPDPEGNYRHFLANGLEGAARTGGNTTFEPENGRVITNYAAPGPIAGTGPHRYAWLVFIEPAGFTAPQNLSSPGVAPSHWSVASYVQQTGIRLVAASFFTVSNGDATGSVAATSAVNTAAIESSATAAGSSTSSGPSGAPTTPPGGSGSTTGPATTGAPTTSAGGNGGGGAAPKLAAGSIVAVALALASVAALF